MKKIVFMMMLCTAGFAYAVTSSLSWEATSIELGKVKVNEVQKISFSFKNSGNESITILEAKGSCGCTIVNIPKESVAPGESATILAEYKSAKTGAFKKSVKIRTSVSEENSYLYFSGISEE